MWQLIKNIVGTIILAFFLLIAMISIVFGYRWFIADDPPPKVQCPARQVPGSTMLEPQYGCNKVTT